jgi:hypothetical protein
VSELSQLLSQLQQQWAIKKQQYLWLGSELQRRGGLEAEGDAVTTSPGREKADMGAAVARAATEREAQLANEKVAQLQLEVEQLRSSHQQSESALAAEKAAAAAEKAAAAAACERQATLQVAVDGAQRAAEQASATATEREKALKMEVGAGARTHGYAVSLCESRSLFHPNPTLPHLPPPFEPSRA